MEIIAAGLALFLLFSVFVAGGLIYGTRLQWWPDLSLDALLGATRSQRQTTAIASIIIATWLLAVIVTLRWPDSALVQYQLGSKSSPVVLQLMAYAFIPPSAYALIVQTAAFLGLLQASRLSLTPFRLVRAYSLGALGGGGCYLAVAWLFRDNPAVSGAMLPLAALAAAIAALEPDRAAYVFGRSFGRLGGLFVHDRNLVCFLLWICLAGLIGRSLMRGNATVVTCSLLTVQIDLIFLATLRLRLPWLILIWSSFRLLHFGISAVQGSALPLDLRFPPALFLALVTALALGAIYGSIERHLQR